MPSCNINFIPVAVVVSHRLVTMRNASTKRLLLSALVLSQYLESALSWQGQSSCNLLSPRRSFSSLPKSASSTPSRRSSHLNGNDDESYTGSRPSMEFETALTSPESTTASTTNAEVLSIFERLQKENEQLRESLQQMEIENDRLLHDAAQPSRIILETFEGERKIRRAESMLDGEMAMDDSSMWCDELEEDTCPVEPSISFSEALRDRAYWLVGLLILQSGSGIILARNEALLANHPVSKFAQSPNESTQPRQCFVISHVSLVSLWCQLSTLMTAHTV
jgi:hypothetical protein